MKNNKLYTNDEIALFEAIEKDMDNGTYKPMENSKLDEKKKLFKQIADNTVGKNSNKESTKLFEK